METLEIIHLRLTDIPPPSLIEEMCASIAARNPGPEVHIYSAAAVPTDMAIHIRTRGRSSKESDLGLRIAAALREHGLVDHTVWIEKMGE